MPSITSAGRRGSGHVSVESLPPEAQGVDIDLMTRVGASGPRNFLPQAALPLVNGQA